MAELPEHLDLGRHRDASWWSELGARWIVKPLRPVFEAEPLILVEDGTPVERNLRRERMTIEEVAAEARLQQISSLRAVHWAVLESNGKISFIQRAGS